MSWRDHCKPIIATVLKENEGRDEKDIRKALREAYPYGERSMHPYKIWCDEIKIQLGKKKPLGKGGRQPVNDPNQSKLF